jgi:hypothetical protein
LAVAHWIYYDNIVVEGVDGFENGDFEVVDAENLPVAWKCKGKEENIPRIRYQTALRQKNGQSLA